MSDSLDVSSEHTSRRRSRNLDVAKSPWERLIQPKVNWLWFILLSALVFVLFMVGGSEWQSRWLILIIPAFAVGGMALYVAWKLIVGRGVLTWRRLAHAPAKAMALGDAEQAERALQRALARARRFGPQDHRRGLMLVDLAAYLKNQGRYPEAKALFEEAVDILALHRRRNPLDYFIALNNFAIYYLHARDYAAAQAILEKVLDLTVIGIREYKNKILPRHLANLELTLHYNLVFLFIEMDELGEARHCQAQVDAIFDELPARTQAGYRAHYRAIRGLLRFAQGRFADAADELALANNPDYPACLRVGAKLHLVRQEFPQAERLLRRYLEWTCKHGSPHRPELRDHRLELAESLFGQGKHDDAFAALAEARALVADFALAPDTRWRRAMQTWLRRAQELGRADVAAALHAEVQKLAAVPEQGITVSDRLRICPALGSTP